MKKNLIFLFWMLLSACAAPTVTPLAQRQGPRMPVSLEVYGFRSLQGALLISVFEEIKGFPEDTELALLNLSVPVTEGRIHVELPPLPAGRYSYSILHDENGNGRMDSNLLGIPREGYALSNNLEGHFGQPEADRALFEVTDTPQHHILRVHYVTRKGKRIAN